MSDGLSGFSYDTIGEMLNDITSIKDDVAVLANAEKRRAMPTAVVSLPEEKKEYPPGGLYIAFVLWITLFWGEPDLLDAIIHFLMK